MRSVAHPLEAGIQGLRSDLELSDVLREALVKRYASDPKPLQEYVRRARRLTYSSTIISCYGLLEQTIDLLLVALAEAYNQIVPSVDDLPESVRNSHRELLVECLRDGDRSRTRGIVNESDVLSALGHSAGDKPGLVSQVFTRSTANYRLPYVLTLLRRLGLDIRDGLYRGRADAALTNTGFANYESFFEDLVQRRNDLAHSYGDEGILDRELLSAYVEIVGTCMLDLIRLANLFMIKVIRDWKLEPVGVVVKAWTGRIGVDLEVDSISVGDQLLLFKNDWCTSHTVEGLQSLGVSASTFTYEGRLVPVGVKIENVPAGAEGCEAFILPVGLRDYWPSVDKSGPAMPTSPALLV